MEYAQTNFQASEQVPLLGRFWQLCTIQQNNLKGNHILLKLMTTLFSNPHLYTPNIIEGDPTKNFAKVADVSMAFSMV